MGFGEGSPDVDELAGDNRKYREIAKAFGALAERRQAGDISFLSGDKEGYKYPKKVTSEPTLDFLMNDRSEMAGCSTWG